MAESAGSLASALVAAQQAMPTVKTDAENPQWKSRFVSLNGLIEATRPHLNEHGLALVQFPTVSELGQPVLRTILIHGATGEQMEADTPLVGKAETMQQLGSAITYARRYAWAAVLGIAAEDDDDGNNGASPPERPARETKVISEGQRRRLFAVAKEHGVDNDTLKQIITKAGVPEGSTLQIPAAKYDQIVAAVEKAGKAETDAAFQLPAPAAGTAGRPESESERKTRLRNRLTVLCDKAETDAAYLLPSGYESWDAYTQALAIEKFSVESRADLSADQLAELVDQVQAQMVPF